MVTIISGTNRKNNNTKKIALEYQRLLKEMQIDSHFLALDEINVAERNDLFRKMEKDYLEPSDKFIIIMPEYNGSYPGILKLMIDNSDVSKAWHHKKVLLTGVSTGRAGNLRGMEHLTGTLLHMKILVHPNRLPVSVVDKMIGEHEQISDAGTLRAINNQLNEFINF